MSVTKIQLRRDTYTNWSSNNPILDSGELGIDTTNKILKFGDGTTAWLSLDSLVNLTSSQTLTNKTISGSSNTLSNIANSSLTNSSITVNGSAISLGGSATITATATNALTIGTGLSGTSYNGSSVVTIANTGVLTVNGSSGAISNIAVTNADNSFSANQTANSFTVTSSTKPTNGIFLPTTNSIGFSTNSIEGLRIDANGDLINITNATLTSANMRYGDGTTTYANIQGNYLSSTTGSLVFQTLKAGTLTSALTIDNTGTLTLNGTGYQSAGFVKTSASGVLSVDTATYASTSSPTLTTPTIANSTTTAASGLIDFNADAFFFTNNANTSGKGLNIAPQFIYRDTNSTAVANTATSIFGLTTGISLDAGKLYYFRAILDTSCTFSTNNSALQLSWNFSNAPVLIQYIVYADNPGTTNTRQALSTTTSGITKINVATATSVTETLAASGSKIVRIEGYFKSNATTGGTVDFRFQGSAATSTWTINATSWLQIQKVASSGTTVIAGGWA